MGKYILKRLLLIIPTVFLILLTNFAIVQSAPGGPVEQKISQIEAEQKQGATQTQLSTTTYQGSRGLSPDMVEAIKKQYGFDKSAPERFWLMLTSYAKGDFGTSFFKGKPVGELILDKMPVSISLGLWSTLLIYLIAVPLGIAKARRHNSLMDKTTALLLAVSYAVPVFVLAVVLLVMLAGGSYWQIFPLQGLVSENFDKLSTFGKIKDYFWHLALPITASTIGGFAGLAYLTKFSFMEELNKQYVLTARSKGLSEK
ncbi:MAG: ABC transporter permease subunit, partial [Moraxella sp.]|nr:ABC transporter permease subunit [Moraxella sp.]